MINYTIITATFNSEKTLCDTINSVLNQSYKNIEYIIVDGGSTDKTLEIINSYENKFITENISFKFLFGEDDGVYDAWNKGLKMASGKWISFLGSDDIYQETALQAYHEAITDFQEKIDFVYSKILVTKNGNVIRKIDGKWTWKIFKRKMNIPHVGAFHNIEYFKSYGFFNTEYKIAGDYELLLRAGNNLKTQRVNETTVLMSQGGLSDKLISIVLKETLKAKNETGKVNLFTCYVDYLIEYSIIFSKNFLRLFFKTKI